MFKSLKPSKSISSNASKFDCIKKRPKKVKCFFLLFFKKGKFSTLLENFRIYESSEALVFILIRFRNFPHDWLDVCAEYITTINILSILDKYFTRIQLFLVRSQGPFAALVDCKEKRIPLLDQVISSQSEDH